MKKLIAMVLAALLLLSLAACGQSAAESPVAYVPSEDVEVAVGFINDGEAKVVTRRTSDKELTSIDLCCVYFLNGGGQVGEAETIQCDFSTEGKLSIWSFDAQPLSAYMECIVSSVTYADGTEQTCPGVSAWVNQTVENFSEERYNRKMEELANKEAAAAEKCDAVEITLGTPAEGSLELGVKNTSGKEINVVVAYLLWFDANGAPVDAGGVLVSNSGKISAETLKVDEEASYTAAAPETAASAKAVVQSVTFGDGTVWENEYVYEWAISNYASAE